MQTETPYTADRETVQKLRLYLDVPGAKELLLALECTCDCTPEGAGVALALSVLRELAGK